MMKRIFLLFISQLLMLTIVFSQNEDDALRYSMTSFGGTARSMGMGGAFGSLGADFSTLSTNPGGIGLYTKSELTVTPSFYGASTKSTYNGMKAKDNRFNFNVSNAGMVFASPTRSSTSIFKNIQFAFGINRINNFNNRQIMEGTSNKNSVTDTYVDYANGIYFGDIEDDVNGNYAFDLAPAWYTYMIDTLPGYDNQYFGAVPAGSNIYQRMELNSRGSMNEMVLSFGTNVADRLYVGATFGFPFIRYFEEAWYTEVDVNDQIYDFNKLSQYNELNTTGSGFNFKFGMIARAADWLRIGGAIHTPTWYNNMSDSWYSEYATEFDNGDNFSERSPIGYYDYQLETPWKAIGSLSFIIAQRAIISAEYEYMDYTSAKLRSPQYNFFDENSNIQSKYVASHNFRAGGEYRVDAFYFRAGGAYYMSPYANDINDAARFYYTGGIGIRDRNFFIDLAYVRSVSESDYYMYSSPEVTPDPVSNRVISNNVLLTLGFRY
ncbi:MAG: hypothetical protein KQI35_05840 [Bacteroidetes bacterium]|nr:hypothetical protein [Bacteroidota bacterium]